MIDTIILMFFGAVVGWLVSKPSQNLRWDIVMGIVGALASSALISSLGIPGATGYNTYTFMVALMGAVAIIYIGRTLDKTQKQA